MQKVIACLFLFLVFFSIVAGAKTYALVIGIGEFLDPSIPELPGAESDARLFAGTLEELGVASENEGTLRLLLNPTFGELIGEIAHWSNQGCEQDRHLFFYAGHAETLGEESEKKTLFIPKDAMKKLLDITSVGFESHVVPLLKDIPGTQTLIFLDACYSGSVIKERPVFQPKLEMDSFKELAVERKVQILVSSLGDEKSMERLEGEGGYFTHYLVRGMKGEANANGDEEILLGELQDFLFAHVVEQTQGKQHPDCFGELEAFVLADNTQLARNVLYLLADPLGKGELSSEEFNYYRKILYKNPSEYSELERQVRKYLDAFAQNRDVLALQGTVEALREKYEKEAEEETATASGYTEKMEQPGISAQAEGNCYLQLRSGNELVEGARIILNGMDTGMVMASTNAGGVLLVGLSKGIHRVAIQGNEMESEEFQVALTDEFTVHTVEVIGQGVQRTVVIQTQPSEARIEINGEELQMLSPTTYKTNVGDTLHIRAHKEGYNTAEMEQRIGEKGVPLEVTLHLERNNPPEMPVQLAPGNTETGTTPLLQWMANDTDDETLLFDVFFLEASQWKQVAQGLATPEFQVSGLAYGNQYSWKVVVTDGHGNQTEGIPWSFSTQDLPQTLRVQIVSEPEGAQVEVDDLHIGMAPVNIELQAGDHQVRVSEEGYFTEEKTISVDISGGNPKSLQRERIEQFVLRKKTGRATIATEPGGGDIYINGVYEGTGFLTIEEEEGDISVKVEKEGYQPKTQSIKIEAGKEITQIIVLEKDAPGTGILRVSNPEKLSIYVDGKFVGWDKAFEMEAEEGIHTVELKRAGRTVSRQMISVEKAQEGGKQPQETTQTIVIGTRGEVPPGMVLVQAGSFQMGNTRNDNEGEDSEKPVHEVTFTYDYLIGRYEVTFDEFDTYSSATGRIPPDDLFMGRGSRPVINVSWEEAIGYCNWLSEKEGLANAYDKNGNLLDRNGERTDDLSTVEGYRLPTEAEWEYAARGGHKSVQDFKYAGSNNISLVGWYDTHEAEQESTPGREQSSGPGFFQFNVASVIVMDNQTHFGGELEPNELGVYDMSGNVSEWCHDWWDPNWYEQGAQTNPIGPRTGAFRVQRGGSWTSTDARLCRIAYRFRYKPTSDCEYIGFRLAKTY